MGKSVPSAGHFAPTVSSNRSLTPCFQPPSFSFHTFKHVFVVATMKEQIFKISSAIPACHYTTCRSSPAGNMESAPTTYTAESRPRSSVLGQSRLPFGFSKKSAGQQQVCHYVSRALGVSERQPARNWKPGHSSTNICPPLPPPQSGTAPPPTVHTKYNYKLSEWLVLVKLKGCSKALWVSNHRFKDASLCQASFLELGRSNRTF